MAESRTEAAIGLGLFTTMARIRAFEERIVRAFRRGEIPGFVHVSIGAEAVAAGVCGSLRTGDRVTTTHRGHGHSLAKGAAPQALMSEIFGRSDGVCRGRGGSMHLVDTSVGLLGANGIVGGGLAIAAGAALACRLGGGEEAVVAFFGDGAANEGAFHESLNLAAIWDLPVVYVCENNGIADATPTAYSMRVATVAERATAYGIPGTVIDGQDAIAVHAAMTEPLRRARAGEGPTLVEALTGRVHGHYEGDPDRARDAQQRDAIRARDPITILRERLLGDDATLASRLTAIEAEANAEMDDALLAARNAPLPDPDTVTAYAYPEPGGAA